MTGRIVFIGNPESLTPPTSTNTGNVIHGYAARRLFADPETVSPSVSPENIERIRSRFTHLGFAGATILHTTHKPPYLKHQKRLTQFIETLDLPVCAFGFGCQAPLNQRIADAQVPRPSIRLLRSIAERSKTVAVRGEFTADLCAKYGVKNVEPIGCQSVYHATASLAPADLQHRDRTGRYCATLSLGPDESRTYAFMLRDGLDYIAQGNPTETLIAEGELSREAFLAKVESGEQFRIFPVKRQAIEAGRLTYADFWEYTRQHFRKFYTYESWVSAMRSDYDFAFGTRFHGGVAAMAGGVPNLWLVHDMRLKELCEQFALPALELADFPEDPSIERLRSFVSFAPMFQRLPRLMGRFLDYIDGNGAGHLMDPGFRSRAERIAGRSSTSPAEPA